MSMAQVGRLNNLNLAESGQIATGGITHVDTITKQEAPYFGVGKLIPETASRAEVVVITNS